MQLDTRQRRWGVTVLAVLGMAVTLRAGCWQLDRAQQKVAAAAQQQAGMLHPPLNANALLRQVPLLAEAAPLPEARAAMQALRERRVLLQGRWLTEQTVYLDNRSMQGQAGFFVLTPLALLTETEESAALPAAEAGSSGRQTPVVWVQRGWVPRHRTQRELLPPVETPAGIVTVQGRLAERPSQRYALGADSVGLIRQNLEPAQMLAPFQSPVLGMVVVQTGAPSEGLLRDWPSPDFGAAKNRGYALQWFGMAALILVLYVWFQLIRPRLARRIRGG